MTAMTLDSPPFVLALTGASGAAYAVRLLEVLLGRGHHVHLAISRSAATVLAQELDVHVQLDAFQLHQLLETSQGTPWWSRFGNAYETSAGGSGVSLDSTAAARVQYHGEQDFMAPIASGSYRTRGMVICPCSGGTLSGVVHGASGNLIERAAEVHLKEQRKLILVPRETPLSRGYLNNLRLAAECGAVVLPAMPGWYHGVRSVFDLIDFVVARILDQLGVVDHALMRRWSSGDSN